MEIRSFGEVLFGEKQGLRLLVRKTHPYITRSLNPEQLLSNNYSNKILQSLYGMYDARTRVLRRMF